MLHKLLNVDDPKCLYCQSSCEIFSQGENGLVVYFVDMYTCVKCHETFGTHYIKDMDIHGTEFSCNDLIVYHDYIKNLIGIRRWEDSTNFDFVWLPYFVIDFSNKEILYNKLKVYLIFA